MGTYFLFMSFLSSLFLYDLVTLCLIISSASNGFDFNLYFDHELNELNEFSLTVNR